MFAYRSFIDGGDQKRCYCQFNSAFMVAPADPGNAANIARV